MTPTLIAIAYLIGTCLTGFGIAFAVDYWCEEYQPKEPVILAIIPESPDIENDLNVPLAPEFQSSIIGDAADNISTKKEYNYERGNAKQFIKPNKH